MDVVEGRRGRDGRERKEVVLCLAGEGRVMPGTTLSTAGTSKLGAVAMAAASCHGRTQRKGRLDAVGGISAARMSQGGLRAAYTCQPLRTVVCSMEIWWFTKCGSIHVLMRAIPKTGYVELEGGRRQQPT